MGVKSGGVVDAVAPCDSTTPVTAPAATRAVAATLTRTQTQARDVPIADLGVRGLLESTGGKPRW